MNYYAILEHTGGFYIYYPYPDKSHFDKRRAKINLKIIEEGYFKGEDVKNFCDVRNSSILIDIDTDKSIDLS